MVFNTIFNSFIGGGNPPGENHRPVRQALSHNVLSSISRNVSGDRHWLQAHWEGGQQGRRPGAHWDKPNEEKNEGVDLPWARLTKSNVCFCEYVNDNFV